MCRSKKKAVRCLRGEKGSGFAGLNLTVWLFWRVPSFLFEETQREDHHFGGPYSKIYRYANAAVAYLEGH